MKKFKIEVVSKKPKKIAGELCEWGQITIGDYKEKFIMSLDSWTIQEYKQQWKEGIDRLKTHNVSCLIADISTLETNPRMSLWALYKVRNMVYVQIHILGGQTFKRKRAKLPPYNAQTCYLYLMARATQPVDEWSIDLYDFFASLSIKTDGEDYQQIQ